MAVARVVVVVDMESLSLVVFIGLMYAAKFRLWAVFLFRYQVVILWIFAQFGFHPFPKFVWVNVFQLRFQQRFLFRSPALKFPVMTITDPALFHWVRTVPVAALVAVHASTCMAASNTL